MIRYCILIIFVLVLGSCKVSQKMIKLPKPKNLVPLERLEDHLNYTDPYDSLPSYYREEKR